MRRGDSSSLDARNSAPSPMSYTGIRTNNIQLEELDVPGSQSA